MELTGKLKRDISAIDYALDVMEDKCCRQDDIQDLVYAKKHFLDMHTQQEEQEKVLGSLYMAVLFIEEELKNDQNKRHEMFEAFFSDVKRLLNVDKKPSTKNKTDSELLMLNLNKDNENLKIANEKMYVALNTIAHPVEFLQKKAKLNNATIDGYATNMMANDAQWLRDIAKII